MKFTLNERELKSIIAAYMKEKGFSEGNSMPGVEFLVTPGAKKTDPAIIEAAVDVALDITVGLGGMPVEVLPGKGETPEAKEAFAAGAQVEEKPAAAKAAPKRKRRTKAEIEADNKAAAEAQAAKEKEAAGASQAETPPAEADPNPFAQQTVETPTTKPGPAAEPTGTVKETGADLFNQPAAEETPAAETGNGADLFAEKQTVDPSEVVPETEELVEEEPPVTMDPSAATGDNLFAPQS